MSAGSGSVGLGRGPAAGKDGAAIKDAPAGDQSADGDPAAGDSLASSLGGPGGRHLPDGGPYGRGELDEQYPATSVPGPATLGTEDASAEPSTVVTDSERSSDPWEGQGRTASGIASPETVFEGPRPHPAALTHQLPRRLAIANQKGGVGKTTTAVNLGAALAELDFRVLVVDLDPQGNATTGLGINARNLDASIYDVILHDVPIEDVIEPTTLRNLFVVPATIDLAGAEIELVPVFSRELRLRRALETVAPDFDYILIDCPPSLGLLTVNGLAAASEVVVPIQCEYYALEGLGQLLRNVALVQTNLNTGLEVSIIILTMYDARTRLAEQVVDEVREHFGDRVCRNVVPRTVRLSEAPSFGQPIIVFDPSSRGAIAYRELAKEVSGDATQRVR
jgi:chromosome partitioning protein